LAEIVPVVSEALEAQVRNLLPSQRGFGQDLQASNVIIPVIDLTPTAEGSNLPYELQTAWDFTTTHYFIGTATTTVLTSTPGFYRVNINVIALASAGGNLNFGITDGTTRNVIWSARSGQGTTSVGEIVFGNGFTVYLRAGDTLNVVTDSTNIPADVWLRQIADVNGNLISPSGYSPQ
jgi:hypothetical protein